MAKWRVQMAGLCRPRIDQELYARVVNSTLAADVVLATYVVLQ